MAWMRRSDGAICVTVLLLSSLVTGGRASADDRPIEWDAGGASHNWTDGPNWIPPWVGGPRDNGFLEFVVNIGCPSDIDPDGAVYDPVYFDSPAPPVDITDFFLCGGSRLVLNLDSDLTVLRHTEIAGIIDGQGGNFTACGTIAAFTDCRSRMNASNGSTIEICAPTYCSTGLWSDWDANGGWSGDGVGTTFPDLMKAEGAGSLLDLSTVPHIDAGFASTGNDHTHQRISALDGGVIDLSGVETVTGPGRSRDYLSFIVDPEGSDPNLTQILLPGVRFIETDTVQPSSRVPWSSQQTRFDIRGGASQSLPNLELADGVDFMAAGGGSVTVPSLTQIVNSTFSLVEGSQFIDDTGADAGAATYSSTEMWVAWDANGGWSGDGVGTWAPNLMKAEGAGALLDLSTVTSIDAGFASTGNDHTYHHISALDGGVIDLSGVETVTGPASSRDGIRFTVDSCTVEPCNGDVSTLDMSSLAMVTNTGNGGLDLTCRHPGSILNMSSLATISALAGGIVSVDTADGGHIQMGDVRADKVDITIDLNKDATEGDAGAILSLGGLRSDNASIEMALHTETDLLDVSGNLLLGSSITLAAPNGGTVRIGGHFLHEHGEPADSNLDLGNATVECVGEWQALEVAGAEYGPVPPPVQGQNFGYRQLVVGQPDRASVVELVDLYENLDPFFSDALYLWGVEDVGGAGGVDGLRILGGSTLVIGNLSVYARLDVDAAGQTDGVMEWVRINNLIGAGERRVAFDQGFIDRGPVLPDCNGNGVSDAVDIASGFSQDCDTNGIPDECDIFGCVSDPACDDCNVNGIPDGCDITDGTSTDANGDGVPDECIKFDDGGADHNWSTAANWVADEVPDTTSEAAAVEGYLVDLDIPVTIASLQLLEGATLNVTGLVDEDLATAGDMRIAGSANGLTETQLLIGNGRAIDVDGAGSGRLKLTSGGAYRAAPGATPSGSLTASEVLITSNACGDFRGGSIDLSGTMSATVTGDFILRGNANCPGFPAGSAAAARGGFTPPIKKTREQSTVTVEGNLRLIGPAGWVNESSGGVTLLGDFDNQGTAPSWFDWIKGRLVLDGTSGSGRTVEVAGLDLGDTLEGFATDQDALLDTRLHRNYSAGALEVAAGSEVRFVNAVANTAGAGMGAEALYVRTLTLGSGATATIDNCRVYYMWLDDAGATINKIGSGDLLELTGVWDAFPGCLGGPNAGTLPMECEVLDFDNDGDVDLSDAARYQLLRSEHG